MSKLDTLLKGTSKEIKDKIAVLGIKNLDDLVKKGATEKTRKKLAVSIGLEEDTLYILIKRADLMRIKGLS